ncbi:hypothetical protein [Halomonas sp. N3-2A]|uniref:hypothetical protein n=1 Tax=Halomonas sp. N3-2A TaxID=2014541 RepID=UPI0012FD37DA|nr:hypothetical protein [Halomonas sp. N3-2A]
MGEKEWVSKAKSRLVECGFPDNQSTQDYAQSLHDAAVVEVDGYEDCPEEIVDQELTYY